MNKLKTSSRLPFTTRFAWILTTFFAVGVVVAFWWSSFVMTGCVPEPPVYPDCCAFPVEYPLE